MNVPDACLRDIEAAMSRALGPTTDIHERSRRVVAALQISAGREPSGLDRKEEAAARAVLQEAG